MHVAISQVHASAMCISLVTGCRSLQSESPWSPPSPLYGHLQTDRPSGIWAQLFYIENCLFVLCFLMTKLFISGKHVKTGPLLVSCDPQNGPTVLPVNWNVCEVLKSVVVRDACRSLFKSTHKIFRTGCTPSQNCDLYKMHQKIVFQLKS